MSQRPSFEAGISVAATATDADGVASVSGSQIALLGPRPPPAASTDEVGMAPTNSSEDFFGPIYH